MGAMMDPYYRRELIEAIVDALTPGIKQSTKVMQKRFRKYTKTSLKNRRSLVGRVKNFFRSPSLGSHTGPVGKSKMYAAPLPGGMLGGSGRLGAPFKPGSSLSFVDTSLGLSQKRRSRRVIAHELVHSQDPGIKQPPSVVSGLVDQTKSLVTTGKLAKAPKQSKLAYQSAPAEVLARGATDPHYLFGQLKKNQKGLDRAKNFLRKKGRGYLGWDQASIAPAVSRTRKILRKGANKPRSNPKSRRYRKARRQYNKALYMGAERRFSDVMQHTPGTPRNLPQ